jgi:phosphoribosylpyrophosphate synthetase
VRPISIAPLLAEAIERIHNGKSVTSLFDLDV